MEGTGEREMSMDAHHHGVYNERLVRSTPSQRGGRPRGGALLVGGAKSRAAAAGVFNIQGAFTSWMSSAGNNPCWLTRLRQVLTLVPGSTTCAVCDAAFARRSNNAPRTMSRRAAVRPAHSLLQQREAAAAGTHACPGPRVLSEREE